MFCFCIATAPTESYPSCHTLSRHDALPILPAGMFLLPVWLGKGCLLRCGASACASLSKAEQQAHRRRGFGMMNETNGQFARGLETAHLDPRRLFRNLSPGNR